MTLRGSVGALLVALACLAGPGLGGCVLTPTKVASGELYRSGDAQYDPYFAAVHREQVAATRWADEAKAARGPIIDALELRPGAGNAGILAATRSQRGDASLAPAVERTRAAERERARRLQASARKLDELHERGEALKRRAVEDRRRLGVGKADEAERAKKDEVKREVAAAVDAVESMAQDARRAAREAEELAAKLHAAWSARGGEPADAPAEEGRPKPAGEPPPKPEPAAKKPAKPRKPRTAKPPSEKGAPGPAPAQKAPEEVFNP